VLNGAIAGLAGITPASGFIEPQWGTLVSVAIGVGGFYSIFLFKGILKIDDALDVSSVHGVTGIIGSLAIGVYLSALFIIVFLLSLSLSSLSLSFFLLSHTSSLSLSLSHINTLSIALTLFALYRTLSAQSFFSLFSLSLSLSLSFSLSLSLLLSLSLSLSLIISIILNKNLICIQAYLPVRISIRMDMMDGYTATPNSWRINCLEWWLLLCGPDFGPCCMSRRWNISAGICSSYARKKKIWASTLSNMEEVCTYPNIPILSSYLVDVYSPISFSSNIVPAYHELEEKGLERNAFSSYAGVAVESPCSENEQERLVN